MNLERCIDDLCGAPSWRLAVALHQVDRSGRRGPGRACKSGERVLLRGNNGRGLGIACDNIHSRRVPRERPLQIVGANGADGAGNLHDEIHRSLRLRILPYRDGASLRVRRKHNGGAGLARKKREALVKLLGDIWHEGMKKAETIVQAGVQNCLCRVLCCSIADVGRVKLHDRFDRFEINITQFVVPEVVNGSCRIGDFIRLKVLVDGTNDFREAREDPSIRKHWQVNLWFALRSRD
mmetsp:Transcript_12162/g.37274  ORF Transcript_12162/g.37274 Transcript_12162/m.37274 type:complete len:237 (-) Transcript_12162:1452-2162(-)